MKIPERHEIGLSKIGALSNEEFESLVDYLASVTTSTTLEQKVAEASSRLPAVPLADWNAIIGNGGEESECGWCKDKWGLSWQITPMVLIKAVTDPERAVAKRAFNAMMQMKKINVAAIEAACRS